jgi:two-component system, NtrC family, response regulator AtoC
MKSTIPHIVIVDDDAEALVLLRDILPKEEYEVETANTGNRHSRKRRTPSTRCVDVRHLHTGVRWIGSARRKAISQSCHADESHDDLRILTTAMDSILSDAFHYLSKPFILDDVCLVLYRAVEHAKGSRQNQHME